MAMAPCKCMRKAVGPCGCFESWPLCCKRKAEKNKNNCMGNFNQYLT